MARMKIMVALDIDLDKFRAEYSDTSLTQADIHEHIRSDVAEVLANAPYADAIKKSEVR